MKWLTEPFVAIGFFFKTVGYMFWEGCKALPSVIWEVLSFKALRES